MPYVPFGWDRLWLRGTLPDRIDCVARLREDPAETLTADLDLYADDGSRIGGITGLTARRATREAMLAAFRDEDDLVYEVAWRPREAVDSRRAAEFLVSPSAVAARSAGIHRYLAAEAVDPARQAAFAGDLERLSRSFARAALLELGWRPAGDDAATTHPDGLSDRLADGLADPLADLPVLRAHRALAARLLALAGEDIAHCPDPADPFEMAARLAREYPFGRSELALLQRCGAALADVLRGQAQPLDLLFGDDRAGAEAVYREAPAARAANRHLADAVAALAGPLPEGRSLRILEVGGGTGASTEMVLESLPAGRFSYHFTDVSAAFLEPARQRFAGYPLTFGVLDIERDPVEQGFAAHGFDLVIAAQVLHATRDLSESLDHSRRLLAPSGALVLLEGLQRQAWLDLTFGLLDGWWRFADAWRRDGALIDAALWTQALAGSGFGEAEVLPAGFDDHGRAVQGVLLARAPETLSEAPGVWVVAAEGPHTAQRLAATLAARRQTVVLASAETGPAEAGSAIRPLQLDLTRREAWRSVFEDLPNDAPFRRRGCGS